jgi:hypothetical protein
MSKSIIASPVLETITAEDLAAASKALGIKVGKSKKATIAALLKAGDEGKVHFKSSLTISFKPDGGTRTTFLGRTCRNYTSGPGENDVTWLTPANAVQGSPAEV